MKRPVLTLTLAILLAASTLGAASATSGGTIGNDAIDRSTIDTYSNFTIVDTNNPASMTGLLTDIEYYAGAVRPLRFVLVDGTTVRWVSEQIQPGTTGVNTEAFDPPVPIREGWNLAVYSVEQGVVTFAYGGAPSIWTPNNNGLPSVGTDLTVESSTQGRTYSMGGDIVALTTTIAKVNEHDLGVTWFTTDTREGGSIAFVTSETSPYGGAVQLATADDVQSKANLARAVDPVALEDLTALSYHTYQVTGPALAAASYQLLVTFDGGGWTWLVYEPYWQNGTGDPFPVAAEEWQEWDLLDGGRFWSSRTAGGLTAGAGGPPLYTLDDVIAMDNGATVGAIALNVGTYNPGWTVLADGMTFGTFDGITIHDFEPAPAAPDPAKDQCKAGGWEQMADEAGREFHNQGDCVSYYASEGKSRGGGKNR
jgi:hypothetical protein